MGCSTSKLDDEEVVQLCKDRKNFIKQAVEQRTQFALGHLAYIQSMKRVSAALKEYIEGDEHHELLLDSFVTPPFTPIKKSAPGFISISPKSFLVTPFQVETDSSFKVSYLRSGGVPSVSVEERPRSSEMVRMETYSPVHQYSTDSFLTLQSPPINHSFFQYSPDNRPNFPPPSPQTSQWDVFWDPFSSLDYYCYPTRSSLDHAFLDDEAARLGQVREEEGIPEIEEETEREDNIDKVGVEDVDDDVDADDDEEEEEEIDSGTEEEPEVQKLTSNNQNIDVAKVQNTRQISTKETAVADGESKEETPGFTVYLNQKPASIAEVIKDLDAQFMFACNSAREVSAILEASRAQYASPSNDHTAMSMLNPVALIRSASSLSLSARYLVNSSVLKDEGTESSSDFSEETHSFPGSHQSTLDRLYAWEKKLYKSVREGERLRIAYDKKCTQFKHQNVKGADPPSVEKTRTAIRDLHTRMKVSIHSVEAISKRIETLRDEELQPRLLELVQGLCRMWKVMAECHQLQKQTLDEAKILLADLPSTLSGTNRLARSAAILETELRNWRACFESWVVAQRSYMQALTGWLLRCVRLDADSSNLPFSPSRSSGTLPILNICIQWSRLLDSVREVSVLEGLDFLAAGVGQLTEDSRNTSGRSKRFGGEPPIGNLEVVEAGEFEEEVMMTAEIAIRVLCAGMSVAVSSLAEFAGASAEGYSDLNTQLVVSF